MPKNMARFINSRVKSKKKVHPTLFNSNKADNIATKALKQSVDFINSISSFVGFSTGSELKINRRLVFTVSLMAFTWIQIFYTQLKYCANGEYKRIFEVFALYGIGVSVTIMINCLND